MNRPEFVSNEDIARWSNIVDKDDSLSQVLKDSTIIREVCYAGLWLAEELSKLSCEDDLITRIQWTAGKLSFGRDTWKVHQNILQEFKDNKLVYDD